MPFCVSEVSPDAGEAVGLQFDTDRHLVGLGLAHLLPHLVELRQHADEVLHVMADLVRDHVGLGEIARRAELAGQLVEEVGVEIDLAVVRTVERPGCRTRRSRRPN